MPSPRTAERGAGSSPPPAPAPPTLAVRPAPPHPGRLVPERVDVLLAAAQHRMNTSRNHAARELVEDLLAEHPHLAKAYAFLGCAVGRMGDPEASIAYHEQAVRMDPKDLSLHSTLIFALDQSAETTLERAYRARRAFNDAVRVDPSEIPPHENDPDPDRRLRVGYVSADFKNHSAAYGFGPIILAADHSRFELFAYASNQEEDDRTADFRRAVDHYVDASVLSDEQLAEKIREDRIDILVDLSGHSAGNRLAAFARKPAPVQVTGFGYITGTGLDAMDYLLADGDTVLPEEERWFAEEIVRLPRILTCWAPDATRLGPPGPLPSDRNGHLTFGVYNRLGKIQPACTRAWAEILRRLPTARLIVKAPGLDDEAARLALEAMFAAADAPLERLEFRGMTAQNDHLKSYDLIDLNLDPSPHGGGMSTLDAAWRGVPTLTLPHIQIVSRIATTINRELGLGYLVSESWPDYIARAVALDGQRDELRRVRGLLPDLMTVSSFGDHVGYTRCLEARYREVWRRWCEGRVPEVADRANGTATLSPDAGLVTIR